MHTKFGLVAIPLGRFRNSINMNLGESGFGNVEWTKLLELSLSYGLNGIGLTFHQRLCYVTAELQLSEGHEQWSSNFLAENMPVLHFSVLLFS
jgi:hypothetical protein